MITNIQILRGLAALGVVFYHTQYMINGVRTEFFGVPIFFVISGFIMCVVNNSEGNEFFVRRIIRIVPLYWLMTILIFHLWSMGFAEIPHVFPDKIALIYAHPLNFFTWVLSPPYADYKDALLKSLFFIPYTNPNGLVLPFLGVGWTLNLEMMFYVLIAIYRVASKTAAPLATAATVILVHIAAQTWPNANFYLTFYGKDVTLNFVYGVVAYYIWRLPLPKKQWLILPIKLVALLCPIIALVYSVFPNAVASVTGSITTLVVELMPFSVVLSFLMLSRVGVKIHNPMLMFMGGASYSLYLVHEPLMVIEYPFIVDNSIIDYKHNITGVAIIMFVSILIASLFYKYVEQPLLHWLRTFTLTPEHVENWLSKRTTRSVRADRSRAKYFRIWPKTASVFATIRSRCGFPRKNLPASSDS